MMKKHFFGRQKELKLLKTYKSHGNSKFIVITGRRRIGKSRLVEEFASDTLFLKFSGLAPNDGINASAQREEFGRVLKRQFDLPPLDTSDWGDLFDTLGKYTFNKKMVLMFDEASWMGMDDPTFLPKLKNLWDDHLNQNPNLIFILCSSVSYWIEENVLSSTGFVGRVHHVIHLDELPLSVCNEFFNIKGCRLSPYEKFKMLAVTGGVPLYLESLNPAQSAEQNIARLCFTKGGLLVREFTQIFTDLFSKRNLVYRNIVHTLIHGPMTMNQIAEQLGVTLSGQMSEYLDHLIKAGFIKRDFTWDIKTGQHGKLSQFRLSDNYLRFYLKYIELKLNRIDQIGFDDLGLESLPQYHTIMGLQFENLVARNALELVRHLGLSISDIINFGPYYQTKTQRVKGCQIDVLIQTRHNTLYIIEVKFSKKPIGCSVMEEMESKLGALSLPRNFSTRTVLVHVNGITEALEDEHYFAHIIDFSVLLSQKH